MTAADWPAVAPYFRPEEFHAPERMGVEFLAWLAAVRQLAGVPFVITSDARTFLHNAAVGGATDSAHLDVPCNAVDLAPRDSAARMAIVRAALDAGCVRIGLYPNGSIHLDRTEDRRPAGVLWVTVSHPARVPTPAAPTPTRA